MNIKLNNGIRYFNGKIETKIITKILKDKCDTIELAQ